MEQLGPAWHWLTSDTGSAVATWLGLVVAGIGIPAAIAGAFGAKGAAKDAKAAAESAGAAVAALSSRMNLSNASYTDGQMALLLYMIQNEAYAEAERHFVSIKRTILHLQAGAGPLPEPARAAVQAIETQLSKARVGAPGFKQSVVVKALNGLAEHLAAIEKTNIHRP